MSSNALSTTPPAARPLLSSRIASELGGSGGGAAVWARVTEMARQPNIVADLGQGFPDYQGSPVAIQVASEALSRADKSRLNQYSLVNGSVRLRDSIANYFNSAYAGSSNRPLDGASNVVVTTSGTEALYAAVMATVDPGDEVVIFEPFFPWYLPDVRLAGGTPKLVPLQWPDFRFDEAVLRAAFTDKTKLVIVNSPHNPTGHVMTGEELELIAKLCVEHNVVCVSDEVYEWQTFGGREHIRMTDFPGMEERTITVGSASKMFSVTGWRVGWCYGPADLIAGVRALHGYASYCAPAPLQEGVAAALDEAAKAPRCVPPEVAKMTLQFEENAKDLVAALKHVKVNAVMPEGGYFVVGEVEDEKFSDVDFCMWLAKERGVVCVPMSVFFGSANPPTNLVRFSICKERTGDTGVVARAVKAILG